MNDSFDPVIEVSHLGTLGPIRLLDVRDADLFAKSHASGAVRVPIEQWEAAAKASETSLDNVAFWQSAIAALGITNEAMAAVYDDGGMTEAARVWFILQYFGVKAFIINGGWPAIDGKGPWQDTNAPEAGFKADPNRGRVGLVDRNRLRQEIGTATKVFDARTAAEHFGEDLRKNKRGGHIPGARHLAHAELLDNGRLREAGELRSMLDKAGFQAGDHIVTHCDGGGRAALAAAAALRAGYTNVRVYYLSFSDWASDDQCPVVRN